MLSRVDQPVIVGAGISGLYCYHVLKQKKYSPLLISDSTSVGGRLLDWGGWNNSVSELKRPTYLKCTHAQWRTSLRRAAKFLNIKPQKISPLFKNASFKKKNKSFFKPSAYKAKTWPHLQLKSISHKNNLNELVFLNRKTKKKISLQANKTILACSPMENCKILFNSKLKAPSLGKLFNNHLVVTAICLFPTQKKMLKSQGYQQLPNGIREISGPFPGIEIAPDLKKYSYLKLHTIINLPSSPKRNILLKKFKIQFSLSPAEKRIIKKTEKESLLILKKLPIENTKIFCLGDSHHYQNISHETGGCVMSASSRRGVANLSGEVFGTNNLFLMDSSLFPHGFPSYPTLPQLAVIDFLLRKEF